MARSLSSDLQHEVKVIYLDTRNIKKTAREAGVSRNAVRRLIRAEKPVAPRPWAKSNEPPPRSLPNLNSDGVVAIDFEQLTKLFEMARHPGDRLDFENYVMTLAKKIATELGVTNSTIDQMKIEFALSEWMTYRRFYLKAVEASDRNYMGTLARTPDKLAKTVSQWVQCYQRALDNFMRIMRDLEIKYHRRIDFGSGNTIINQSDVKIQANSYR